MSKKELRFCDKCGVEITDVFKTEAAEFSSVEERRADGTLVTYNLTEKILDLCDGCYEGFKPWVELMVRKQKYSAE